MDPFLTNPALKPGFSDIYSAHLYFEDILRVRKSSPLFRLQTGDEVKQRVKFYNVGPAQQPALIVMAISDKVGPGLILRTKASSCSLTLIRFRRRSAYRVTPGLV